MMLLHVFAMAAIAVQLAPQSVKGDVRDVLRAVLSHIEPDIDDTILLGRALDSDAQAALRALIPRELQSAARSGPTALPDTAIVFESISISNERATVRLTYGPVPAEVGWVCGQAITIPLRRTDQWQILDDEARVRCAREGPRGLSLDHQHLAEAARLAFSYIGLDPTVRIVSGSRLSSEARASLRAIGEVPPETQVETDAMILPTSVFAVRTLELEGEGVRFAGTLGPVPRHATLACGTNWSMTLRRYSNGWSFEDIKITVC